jgi:hypothetical protein
MRGFLTVLAMAAALVVGGTWIAGPTVAGSVVAAALAASGFSAATQTITIAADPPLELLGGHADAVGIDATGVSVAGIQAGSVVMTLHDVRLIDQGYEAVSGRLTDVTAQSGGSTVRVARVEVSGPAASASATIQIPGAEITDRIREGIRDLLGAEPASVRLAPPDAATIELGGRTLDSRLRIDAEGRLVIVFEPGTGGSSSVVAFDPTAFPGLGLSSVSVSNGDVIVEGTMDMTRLVPSSAGG